MSEEQITDFDDYYEEDRCQREKLHWRLREAENTIRALQEKVKRLETEIAWLQREKEVNATHKASLIAAVS